MRKNKDLFRVIIVFVAGVMLILATPVLFRVVIELLSK